MEFNEEEVIDEQCDYCNRTDGHEPNCLYNDDISEEEEDLDE
jgi:hypothetical protein